MKQFLLFVFALLFAGLAFAAVNINTATKEELEALPGIGPVKAQAIIDHRTANGRFKSIEDVMQVKGIKEGEFAKLKGEIAVTGPNTPVAKSAPAAPAASTARVEPAKAAPGPATPSPALLPRLRVRPNRRWRLHRKRRLQQRPLHLRR
jgi:competence protein ComEA